MRLPGDWKMVNGKRVLLSMFDGENYRATHLSNMHFIPYIIP